MRTTAAGSNHEHSGIDFVGYDAIPHVVEQQPYLELAGIDVWYRQQPPVGSDHDKLPAAKPTETTPEESLINFELLMSAARFEAPEAFKAVIRMGGSFNHLKDEERVLDDDAQALAAEMMGLDASLYYHAPEQIRRAERLAVMNQSTHRKMYLGLVNQYGRSKQATRAYTAFSRLVPNFTPAQVEALKLTGGVHDHGEASLKYDQPFDHKGHAYEEMEAAECVRFATHLHAPIGDTALMRLLQKRVDARRNPRITLTPEEQAETSFYLHPSEITHAVYSVERSEPFKKATEPVEYVLSGIRAFEAVEHNFGNVRDDPKLAAGLLRLGVGTFYNHLGLVMQKAERYMANYDFLRQNEDTISRYLDIMVSDIVSGWGHRGRPAIDLFGIDPFTVHEQGGEPISANEARLHFLKVAGQWGKWRTKTHIIRTLWENYFGTTHRLTANNPDVSFLQYTARNLAAKPANRFAKVPVLKPLVDMFGVGLDSESQAQHQSLVLQETGIA